MNIGGENRYRLEEDYLMNTFLQIKDCRFAEKILGLEENKIPDKDLIPYFFATEILKSDNLEKRQWGYRTLISFFDDEKNLERLRKYNGIQFKDVLTISKNNFYDQTAMNEKLSIYEDFVHAPFSRQVKMCLSFLFHRIGTKIHNIYENYQYPLEKHFKYSCEGRVMAAHAQYISFSHTPVIIELL